MTLTYSEIMIRYGELSTKGKNRMRFINKLRNNIQDVLSIYPAVKVILTRKDSDIWIVGQFFADDFFHLLGLAGKSFLVFHN